MKFQDYLEKKTVLLEKVSSRITIQFDTDNAAFGETDKEKAEEVKRILEELIKKIGDKVTEIPLKDVNGNTVGKLTLR